MTWKWLNTTSTTQLLLTRFDFPCSSFALNNCQSYLCSGDICLTFSKMKLLTDKNSKLLGISYYFNRSIPVTKVWGTFVLVKSIPVTHLLIWAKLFGPQIFLDQKFSLVQCFFGPKIILYQKCYFHIKGFQTHNFLDTKIFFGQKFLWTDFSYNKQNNTIFLGLTKLKSIYRVFQNKVPTFVFLMFQPPKHLKMCICTFFNRIQKW